MIIIIIVIVKKIMISEFADFDVHYLPSFGDIFTMGRRWKAIIIIIIIIIKCFFLQKHWWGFQYFSRYCDGAVLLNLYRTAIVVFAFSLVLIFSWQSIYYVGAFTSHQHWQWHARHRCHCRRREHAAS